MIWNLQAVPDEILGELVETAESVREVLVDPRRPVTNVTEWAKRAACWEKVKEIPFDFPPELADWILSTDEVREKKIDGKKVQKLDNGIEAQKTVLELGNRYWISLRDFGRQMNKLSETDLSIIRSATGETGKLPSEKQSIRLIEIRDRMVDLGFIGR
jgi:hypothetical protein